MGAYRPGGKKENVGRPWGKEGGKVLGQTVGIETRGGAGGTIGADLVARARPDGHTLLLFPTAIFTISPHMMQLPYDVDRAFVPIARVAASDAFVIIHPSVPARHIRALVALATQRPR